MPGPRPGHNRPGPQFIDGPTGPLFAILYAPDGADPASTSGALFLPPFAEEMNRSRRMSALLGRALAARGVATLVLDLHGTGDSAGDFSEARWDRWRQDAIAARAWLAERAQGGISFIGLRLGACLALELAMTGPPPERVVLWSPVVRGDLMLNQFLRIRALSGIGQGGASTEKGETAKALRERLRGGETLEVAGYPLHPELADDLEGLRLARLGAGCPVPITWLEVAGEADAPATPAAATAIEALGQAGLAVDFASVAGEPFWTIEETVVVEALIERTAALWPL